MPSPSLPKHDERSSITWRVVALYVGLALLYFAPAFLPGRQIGGTDYFAGGYHFLDFGVHRLRDGSLPKWVPYIFGGLPMYANPGGLFYPVRVLFSLVLPVDRIMPALFVVQFALAGIGMHVFARALGVRRWVALVAGVAFELTGVIVSYVFAGHDGRIIVATFTPLVFFYVLRGVETGAWRWYLGLAATVGFVMLSAQLQSAYYLLVAAGLWGVFLLARRRRELPVHAMATRTTLGVVAVAIGFALAAVNLVPFAGYVKDSPRATSAKRDFAFSTQFSMPPVETIGLAVPEQAGILRQYTGESQFKLHTEYVGALVLLMLAVGVILLRRDGVWQFMAAIAAFMLSISYGSHTPIYQLYYRFLPGTAKFRSPSIALFMVSFCLVVMAALALERLAQMADDANATGERSTRKLNRFLTACAGVALAAFVVSAGTAFSGSTRAMGWARFALFLWITALVLRALLRGRITVRTTTMALVVLTATDLLVIDRHFIYTEDAPERAFAADDVVGYLKSHTPGRVWVFPFPQQQGAPHYLGNGRFGERSDYLMRFGISQAGGEHGNQLYRWNQFVGIAPGGNVLDWHNFVQHPAMMDAAAIRYILSGVRLQLFDAKTGAGLQGVREVHRGSAFVYVNNRAVARAQLVPSVKAVAPGGALVEMQRDDWDPRLLALVEAPAPPFTSALRQTAPPPAPEGLPASLNAAPGTTQVNVDEPDRVDVAVNATAPAMLVLNDNDAEGWRATIDGRSVPILRTNHTFRGVAVTPGNHLVSFRFEPHSLYTGLWISLATLATILAGAVLVFRESRQRPVTGA